MLGDLQAWRGQVEHLTLLDPLHHLRRHRRCNASPHAVRQSQVLTSGAGCCPGGQLGRHFSFRICHAGCAGTASSGHHLKEACGYCCYSWPTVGAGPCSLPPCSPTRL
jgi:hypothetical protein